jgi:hypothetical protein
MDVKQAIAAAKEYVKDVYAEEQVSNLGLEEVETDSSNHWAITIGFSRPWNSPRTRMQEILENIGDTTVTLKRSYKVITVDYNGTILSMKNRPHASDAA